MKANAELDVIVYGATGYTGQLVADISQNVTQAGMFAGVLPDAASTGCRRSGTRSERLRPCR
jgi:short subunit dehydrogenase-like uncharacterized protein